MIAELKTLLVPYNKNLWEAAYQRILFPEPAESQEKPLTAIKRPTRRGKLMVATDPQ